MLSWGTKMAGMSKTEKGQSELGVPNWTMLIGWETLFFFYIITCDGVQDAVGEGKDALVKGAQIEPHLGLAVK